jgi:hypothetical protein
MNDNPPNRLLPIELATILPGAVPFKEGNVNDTYRGQVLLSGGVVRDAVVKDLDNFQLVNELLASALAKASGLPTPDAYLGLVKAGDLPVIRGPLLADGNRLVFVSADVKVPNVTFQVNIAVTDDAKQAVVARVVNWAKLGDLYAFDAWIANTDRHAGNLLLGAIDEVWLIDHGHSFTGPAWEPSGLSPDGDYANRLKEWVTPLLDPGQRDRRALEVSEIAKVFEAADVAFARSASKIDTIRSSAHGDAIETFLRERAGKVRNHATRALGMLV